MDKHDHQPDVVSRTPARTPSLSAVVKQLNIRLDQRANEIRQFEDRECYYQAIIADQENEITGMTGVLDQVRSENRSLRERLGLPELGFIEPVEDAVKPVISED